MRLERDGDAVGAHAEEHGVGERDDAGVAEQQVVARHQRDEDADARRRIERARAGKQEWREGEAQRDGDQHARVSSDAARADHRI